jgi:hypothetical protein
MGKDIQQQASITAIDARPLELDLFESVAQFANQFEEKGFQKIRSNAGMQSMRHPMTVDG